MNASTRTDVVSDRYKRRMSQLPNVMGLGGAIAGLVGGLAMIIVGAILTVVQNGDIWLEPKAIAAPFFGQQVMQPGFEAGPVIVGTILHFAISALLGAIYSIVTRRVLKLPSDMGVPVLSGLIYGFFIWAVAFFLLLPIFNQALLTVYAPAFIIQHLVYGVVLGLAYGFLRPLPYRLMSPVREL